MLLPCVLPQKLVETAQISVTHSRNDPARGLLFLWFGGPGFPVSRLLMPCLGSNY